MFYDEQEYYESSLADEILEEAKSKIENLVSEYIKNKYSNLQERISEANEEKKKYQDLLRKAENEKRNYEFKIKELERNFKMNKLKSFIKELDNAFTPVFYVRCSESKKVNKCSYCDDKRRIRVDMPDGSTSYVKCTCDTYEKIYEVMESANHYCCNVHGGKGKDLSYSFKFDKYWDSTSDERCEVYVTEISEYSDDLKNEYNIVYKTKNDAQKMADRLNSK